MTRRLVPLVLALVAAVGLLGAPASTTEVRAASPDLTIVADARYDVQPAQRRVRVTLNLTLTNHLADTKTTRYYFDKAFLAVLPGTKAFGLSWAGSGTPTVVATKATKDYTLLRLGLAQRLYSGKSAQYTLRFDLPDPGGAATRDLRIGDSLASFPVWGFGTDSTTGGSVTVVFPKGFSVNVQAGSIPKPTVDATGRVIFHSGTLAQPLSFFAYLVGDRPGAYTTRSVSATVEGTPVSMSVQSWPDDKAWAKRVGDLMAKALPVLGKDVGLPWPRADTLTVREAVSHSTGGYAGLFDPAKGVVEVAYYADSFVVLHESAHGWFNGALLADRWANEGFASYYALQAAGGPEGQGHRRRPDRQAQGVPHPAQRLGSDRAGHRRHRGLRVRGQPRPRDGHRRPGLVRCPQGRLGRRGRACRRLPATRRRHARDRGWRAGLARAAGSPGGRGRGPLRRPVADLGRARRGPAAARRAGRGA